MFAERRTRKTSCNRINCKLVMLTL